jgi:hypothetical protein
MAADSTSPRLRLHELTISKNYESGHKDSIIINKSDDYNILQDAIKEDPLENMLIPLVEDGAEDIMHLMKDAGMRKGALITASTGGIFIEGSPIEAMQDFKYLAESFCYPQSQGILIFIVDGGALAEERKLKSRYRILYNLYIIGAAIQSFAIFGNSEDWTDANRPRLEPSLWNKLRKRFCIIMKDFEAFDFHANRYISRDEIDSLVRDKIGAYDFERVSESEAEKKIEASHVLPECYPDWLDKSYARMPAHANKRYHHWTVRVDDT